MFEPGDPLMKAAQAASVLEAVERHRRFWVTGAPGAGRWGLAQQLKEQQPKTHVIQLPPVDEADSAVHGLLQSAAVLGADALREAATDSKPLQARARQVAEALAREGWTLVVYLPGSWTFRRRAMDPAGLIHQQRGLELLGGWAEARELKLVVLTAPLALQVVPPFLRVLPPAARLALRSQKASRDMLAEAGAWGTYAEGVDRLRSAMDLELDVTPLQLRLMVALVELGDDPRALLRSVASSRNVHARADLDALELRLEGALSRPDKAPLRQGLHRVLQARFPLPLAEAQRLSRLPEADMPLLSRCIGHGDDVVRVDERVRRMLLRLTTDSPQQAEPDAHLELASYHQQRDGALGVEQARGEQVLHWLEKVHHLGHAGARGTQQWSALKLTVREFFWDRARALSIEHRDYQEAAAVYQQCLDKVDPEDAYSWHYLGFNLDRAGRQRRRAEEAFRKAVELDPANPWWNGRLVTFLIEQSRFRAAEEEWRALQERVDPDGAQVRGPSLALNMHRWVVQAWLDRGEVERARRVFNAIPLHVISEHRKLQELRHRLEDAEEVRQLGESVYPAGTPMEARWRESLYLERVNPHGAPLREWFPGRVVHASSRGVRVVVATPDARPEARQVVVRELTRDQWRRATGGTALPRADSFIEVGTYEDDLLRIVPVPSGVELSPRQLMSGQTLRYLRRWA
jgi:tetratricopeptide (TPR) repeat protein